MFKVLDRITPKKEFKNFYGHLGIKICKKYTILKIYDSTDGYHFEVKEIPNFGICFSEYFFYNEKEIRKMKLKKLKIL